MKRLYSLLLTVLLCLGLLGVCNVAGADPRPEFKTFPMLGVVTGEYVRMRDAPGTEGTNILGETGAAGARFVVLGQTQVNGETWYKLENPNGPRAATVWMSGQFVEPVMTEAAQLGVWGVVLTQLNQTYGSTPERAVALHGKPKAESEEMLKEGAGEAYHLRRLEYDHMKLEYLGGHLTTITQTGRDLPFAGLLVGDSEQQVLEVLGEPETREPDYLGYRMSEMEFLNFTLESGVVTLMSYDVHYEIDG